jgi:hypothetical protein
LKESGIGEDPVLRVLRFLAYPARINHVRLQPFQSQGKGKNKFRAKLKDLFASAAWIS